MDSYTGTFEHANETSGVLLVRPGERARYALDTAGLTGSVVLEEVPKGRGFTRSVLSLTEAVDAEYLNQTNRDVYLRLRCVAIDDDPGSETVDYTLEAVAADQAVQEWKNSDGAVVHSITDEGTVTKKAIFEHAVADGTEYAGASSHQTVEADLNVAAGAGNVATNPKFLAGAMGNLLGADLTKEGAYLAGVIAALSVTGARATLWQIAACIGIVMDGVTDADAAVLAVIDGDDPSSQTNARAAFGVAMNNNHPGSGVEFGLDLKDEGRDDLYSDPGPGLPFTITKALVRSPNDVCIIEGDGVPVDYTDGDPAATGEGWAAKGSMYIDFTNGKWYKNTGSKAEPAWTEMAEVA